MMFLSYNKLSRCKVKLVINFLIYLKQYYTLKLSQYLSVNCDTKHRFKINDITSTQKFYTDTNYFFLVYQLKNKKSSLNAVKSIFRELF